MKKLRVAIAQFNGITYAVEEELKRRGHEVENIIKDQKHLKTFDRVVTWNEVHQYGNEKVLEEVNRIGIPTILLQHGRRGTSRIYPPFNEKLICKEVCVWSENDKKRLMSVGTPEHRIHITGTPIFETLKKRVPHEGINVVFSPEHWGEEVLENSIVAGTLRRLKGATVYTKAIKNEHYLPQYDNVILSDRQSPEHLGIVADVLSTADVVVAISESTFELCAEILDIPVVIADIWQKKACLGDERYKEFALEYSPACHRVQDMSKLNDAIMYAVKHPEHLREERKQIAVDDGGINLPDPAGAICDVIEHA